MVTALPSRIMNYNVSAASPTDELLTLGQILAEVGDYTSTVLDREHLSLSRKCGTRLKRVVSELISRHIIRMEDDLYDMPQTGLRAPRLSALSVAELHSLYRSWPIRHKAREAEGREQFTFYCEGKIVGELLRRKACNKAEQLKIDYCVATYHNELDNMSFVLSLPVQVDSGKIPPVGERKYTPEELRALIRLYRDYRDVMEREILVEYVDFALDLLGQANDAAFVLGLLAEIVELGLRKRISVPEWANKKLEGAVNYCESLIDSASGSERSALAKAMITLQMLKGDDSLIRKARRIINRCYKSAFEESADIGVRIENLHTAVTCSDYVTRFSVRKAAALWNELCDKVLDPCMNPASRHIFQMLAIAEEYTGGCGISEESKDRLKQRLDETADVGSIESRANRMIAELRLRDANT